MTSFDVLGYILRPARTHARTQAHTHAHEQLEMSPPSLFMTNPLPSMVHTSNFEMAHPSSGIKASDSRMR